MIGVHIVNFAHVRVSDNLVKDSLGKAVKDRGSDAVRFKSRGVDHIAVWGAREYVDVIVESNLELMDVVDD